MEVLEEFVKPREDNDEEEYKIEIDEAEYKARVFFEEKGL